jgi:hypothetical protein
LSYSQSTNPSREKLASDLRDLSIRVAGSKKVEVALDSKSMPKGKNWMSISPTILNELSEKEAKKLVMRTLLEKGQGEHEIFYEELEKVVGEAKTLALIEKAKK